jgi:F-type H+-transporting ATPase subunit alpha
MEEQVVSIFAGVNGYLDNIAVKDIGAFEAQLLSAMKSKGPGIMKAIREEQKISDETKAQLTAFLKDFATTFTGSKKAA